MQITVPDGYTPWSKLKTNWDKQGIIKGSGYLSCIIIDETIEFENAWLGSIQDCRLFMGKSVKTGISAKRDLENNSCNGFNLRNVDIGADDNNQTLIDLAGTELTVLNNVNLGTRMYENCVGIYLRSELRRGPKTLNINTMSGHTWKAVNINTQHLSCSKIVMEGGVSDLTADSLWLSGLGDCVTFRSRPTYYNVGQVPIRIRLSNVALEDVSVPYVSLQGTGKVHQFKMSDKNGNTLSEYNYVEAY